MYRELTNMVEQTHDNSWALFRRLAMYVDAALLSELRGLTITSVTVGHSIAEVYRFSDSKQAKYYLKLAPANSQDPDSGQSLAEEAKRLNWLHSKIPVPKVECFVERDGVQVLLQTALPGKDASAVPSHQEAERLVAPLAEALKTLHSLSFRDCPFNHTRSVMLERGRRRVTLNLVKSENLDPKNQKIPQNKLFENLLLSSDFEEDLAVCHGDASLPNFIFSAGKFSGFVDLGRLGVADRYQDLALLQRSMSCALNPLYGASLIEPLFKHYGLAKFDREKVEFYVLLDEFF